MTDEGQFRPIETDTMIGNLLHQAEVVMEVDESSLHRRKQELTSWMAEQTELSSDEGEEVRTEARKPPKTGREWQGPGRRGERPLVEMVFLTVAEVASVMRVSKITVYRLVHSGHLPAIRVGRSFRVPEQAIHEFLRDSAAEAVGVEEEVIDQP
jgi:excisionase family DNA binding protein